MIAVLEREWHILYIVISFLKRFCCIILSRNSERKRGISSIKPKIPLTEYLSLYNQNRSAERAIYIHSYTHETIARRWQEHDKPMQQWPVPRLSANSHIYCTSTLQLPDVINEVTAPCDRNFVNKCSSTCYGVYECESRMKGRVSRVRASSHWFAFRTMLPFEVCELGDFLALCWDW